MKWLASLSKPIFRALYWGNLWNLAWSAYRFVENGCGPWWLLIPAVFAMISVIWFQIFALHRAKNDC